MKPYYEHGGITIYHGDCLELIPDISAGLLITDPPYGISYSSNCAVTNRVLDVYGSLGPPGAIQGDSDTMARDTVLSIWGSKRPALVFGSLKAPPPPGWRSAIVWDKGDATGMGDLSIPWKPNFELIFIQGEWAATKRVPGVIRVVSISRTSMGRLHPHEKPIALIGQLLRRCPPGTVLDPFMGSGTTLAAAKKEGRRAIGIEIEERYCEIAARRLAQECLPLT